MNTHALARNLTVALVVALMLVGAIHIVTCDQMACDPNLAARFSAPTSHEVCSLSVCTFSMVTAPAFILILTYLAGRLFQSLPIVDTVSLPRFFPPPRPA